MPQSPPADMGTGGQTAPAVPPNHPLPPGEDFAPPLDPTRAALGAPPRPLPPDIVEGDEPQEEITTVPESDSGWYRVFTPVEGFTGPRLGKTFVGGETVVHTNEHVLSSVPGGKYRKFRLVTLFAQDLGYRIEVIPVGVPPVPRATLAAAGIPAGVAAS